MKVEKIRKTRIKENTRNAKKRLVHSSKKGGKEGTDDNKAKRKKRKGGKEDENEAKKKIRNPKMETV